MKTHECVAAGTEPSPAGAECRYCHDKLPGAVSIICIRCIAMHSRPCTECTTPSGSITKTYRRPPPDRHGVPQDMPVCKVCNNDRIVWDEAPR